MSDLPDGPVSSCWSHEQWCHGVSRRTNQLCVSASFRSRVSTIIILFTLILLCVMCVPHPATPPVSCHRLLYFSYRNVGSLSCSTFLVPAVHTTEDDSGTAEWHFSQSSFDRTALHPVASRGRTLALQDLQPRGPAIQPATNSHSRARNLIALSECSNGGDAFMSTVRAFGLRSVINQIS